MSSIKAAAEQVMKIAERDLRERLAKKLESLAGPLTYAECAGCGNEDDAVSGAVNDTYRYLAEKLRDPGWVIC